MEALFILSIFGIVAGLVIAIAGFANAQPFGVIGLLILAISVFSTVSIVNTDAQRAIDNNAIHERVGVVTEINANHIEIDNEIVYDISGKVKAKFNTSIEGLKIGDNVKVKYLTSVVNDYAAVITPVTITENGGN